MTMETSATIAEITKALSEVQSEIKGAIKDSNNPFFKTKYADLASVWDACRAPLHAHGLAVFQSISGDATGVIVTTMLAHSSGEWVRDSSRTEPKDMSPQSVGSAATYLRRYGLAAIVGVIQVDDDAESAQPDNRRTSNAQGAGKVSHEKASVADRGRVAQHAGGDKGREDREGASPDHRVNPMRSGPAVRDVGASDIPFDPPSEQGPQSLQEAKDLWQAKLQEEGWWQAWALFGQETERTYEEVAMTNAPAIVAHLKKVKQLMGPPPGVEGKFWSLRDLLLLSAVKKFSPAALS